MFKRGIIFLGLMVSSCVTPMASLPEHFRALQVVEIKAGAIKESLLGHISREGKEFNVILIHPAFLSPMVELKGSQAEVTSKWFITPWESVDMSRVFVAITGAYLQSPKHASYDQGFFARGEGGVGYTYGAPMREVACFFPRSIKLELREPLLIEITVTTKELWCQ